MARHAEELRDRYRTLTKISNVLKAAPSPTIAMGAPKPRRQNHNSLRSMPVPRPERSLKQKMDDPNISKVEKAQLLIQANNNPMMRSQLIDLARGPRIDLTGLHIADASKLPFNLVDISGGVIGGDLRNNHTTKNMMANTATFTGALGNIADSHVNGAKATGSIEGGDISNIRGSFNMDGAIANHMNANQPGAVSAQGAQLGAATINTSSDLNISGASARGMYAVLSGPGFIAENVKAQESVLKGETLDPIISGNFEGANVSELRVHSTPQLGTPKPELADAAPMPRRKPEARPNRPQAKPWAGMIMAPHLLHG